MTALLEKNPRDRPTATAALEHPWFKPLGDLQALRAQTLAPPQPPELAEQLIHGQQQAQQRQQQHGAPAAKGAAALKADGGANR